MFQSLVTTDNLTKDHLLLHILQSELYKPRTQDGNNVKHVRLYSKNTKLEQKKWATFGNEGPQTWPLLGTNQK
jgi:hypothetical protein